MERTKEFIEYENLIFIKNEKNIFEFTPLDINDSNFWYHYLPKYNFKLSLDFYFSRSNIKSLIDRMDEDLRLNPKSHKLEIDKYFRDKRESAMADERINIHRLESTISNNNKKLELIKKWFNAQNLSLPEKVSNMQWESICKGYNSRIQTTINVRLLKLEHEYKKTISPSSKEDQGNKVLEKDKQSDSMTHPEETQDNAQPGIIKIEFDKDNRQITYNKKTTEKLTNNQFFIIEYLYKNGKTFYTSLNKKLTKNYDKRCTGLPYEYFKKTKHEYLYNELIESDNTGNYFIKSP